MQASKGAVGLTRDFPNSVKSNVLIQVIKKVADSTVHDNEKQVQGCQLGSQCNTGGAGRKVQLTPLQSSLIPFQQSQAQVVVQVSGYYGVAQRGSYAPT